MKAIVVHIKDSKPLLVWEDVPDIEHGPDEVLVNIKATAVNRADLSQARGKYPPMPGESRILGLEMAGEIAGLGANVKDWQIGDRVCALLPGGGYAQQAAVHRHMLIKLPENRSFVWGAAIPEVWLTAFSNLFIEGNLQPGQTVLIHAGASGVGTSAIQLADKTGASVFVTAGAEHKLSRCCELGAALAINYKKQDFERVILEKTKEKGVDLILDPVGGSYLKQNMKILKTGGCLINIGLMGGARAEMNMGLLLGKSLIIKGSRLRARSLEEKINITGEFKKKFWELMIDGRLKPVIDREFPIIHAQDAHEHVLKNLSTGKVILNI